MIKKIAARRTVARPFVAALLVTLIAAFCLPAANAQSTAKAKPQASTTAKKAKVEAGKSIVVGEAFPAVELKDQSGEVFDMAAALKQGSVALVIFRSADW